MASDPTAGGAPAEMPVEPDDNLETAGKPEAAGELQQLQAEKAELQDKLLRALAEAQNVRRRGQQDVERERKFGIERFAKEMLSVADNLGRALSALPGDADARGPGSVSAGRDGRAGADPGLSDRRPPAAGGRGGGVQGRSSGPARQQRELIRGRGPIAPECVRFVTFRPSSPLQPSR